MTRCSLSVLRTPKLWMAKRVRPDKIEPYSDAKHFDIEAVPVSSLDDIETLLRARLLNDCRAAVVRGALIDPTQNKHVRRLIHDKPGAAATFCDEPRYWCALDLEGIERPGFIDADDLDGCARIALTALPEEFQGVECFVQATASHGIKSDIRLRGWFWLDRAIDSATLKYWLSERAGIDWKSIGAVNPIYTAKPLFRGVADPVPDRLIRLPGKPLVPVPAADVLTPPPPPPPPPPPDVALTKATNSREQQWLVDKLKQRIERALAKLSAATSEKHYALRAAAVTLGGYQEQAGFSDSDAEAWLLAALGPSQTPEKDRDTIRSGVAYGRTKPLLVAVPMWLRRQSETPDKVRPNGSYLWPEETNLPPYYPPVTESREQAEARLDRIITAFVLSALHIIRARRIAEVQVEGAIAVLLNDPEYRTATPEQRNAAKRKARAEVAEAFGFPAKRIPRLPRELLTGSQGNGKTRRVLQALARIDDTVVVWKLQPTLAKAEEDLRDYKTFATEASMPAMVVRGRSAKDPLRPGHTMCDRPNVADRIAKLGYSPAMTICPTCPFRHTCGTMRQVATIEGIEERAVFFMSREYAWLPACPAPKPNIIIGDESMTLPAHTRAAIAPEDLTDALLPEYRGGAGIAKIITAKETLAKLRPLLTQERSLEAIRAAGITDTELRTLRGELAVQPDLDIDGTMTDEQIDQRLDAIDKKERGYALNLVSAILREFKAKRATFQAVRYNPRRNLIEASRLRRIKGSKKAAVLLLDGTGEFELNRRLLRDDKLTHHVVRMERDAMVIGTIGKRYSRQSITGFVRKKNPETGETEHIPVREEAALKLRNDIGQVAAQFPDVLLTATKDAEEALVEGGHLPADVVTSHNGMTRGVNSFEDRQTAIDVGAEAISIDDAELIAGAFFAKDDAPIVPMGRMDDVPENWPYAPWPYRATRLRRMANGMVQAVQVDVHPDPRVQMIIEQIREAGVAQNLDRVRPIYNRRTLVAMNELVADVTYGPVLRHRDLVEGGTRLDRILQRTGGVLPMTPEVLTRLFPDLAGSVSTARRAIRAWRRYGVTLLMEPIGDLTPYRYRIQAQPGRAAAVLVSSHHPDPKAAAEAVLGPLVAFWAEPKPPPPRPQTAASPAQEAPGPAGERPDPGTEAPPPWQRPPGGGPRPDIRHARAPPDD